MSEGLRNLVIVRHGEAEGDRRREAARHGEKYETDKTPDEECLTPTGQFENETGGLYITKNILGRYILKGCDMFYVSKVLRAEQAAVALDISGALWQEDPRLNERDRGHIRGFTKQQHRERYPVSYDEMLTDPLHWTPPDGESMLDLAETTRDFLEDVKQFESVLIVGHRDSMWAFMKPIEGLSDDEMAGVNTDEIRNGQIWFYTADNPETGEPAPDLMWKLVVDPVLQATSGWQILPNIAQQVPELA